MIQVKRVYDEPHGTDGARVLVDRLWPRGIQKAQAQLTLWMKEIAPSAGLRVWYGHQPERFAEFAERYKAELSDERMRPWLDQLIALARQGTLTLLVGAKDVGTSQGVILQKYLESCM